MKLDPKSTKILIVGLGLLGGSYAKKLTELGFSVTAITRSQKSIDYAVSHGMIEKGSAFPDPDLAREADLVVFALYPNIFIKWLEENQALLQYRLVLVETIAKVLSKAMSILGITLPERM